VGAGAIARRRHGIARPPPSPPLALRSRVQSWQRLDPAAALPRASRRRWRRSHDKPDFREVSAATTFPLGDAERPAPRHFPGGVLGATILFQHEGGG